ncbi:MAG TPA: hypothetical protein VGL93_10340 [Streptosporangiaceae bacterium]|jgi:hypothetical protein
MDNSVPMPAVLATLNLIAGADVPGIIWASGGSRSGVSIGAHATPENPHAIAARLASAVGINTAPETTYPDDHTVCVAVTGDHYRVPVAIRVYAAYVPAPRPVEVDLDADALAIDDANRRHAAATDAAELVSA